MRTLCFFRILIIFFSNVVIRYSSNAFLIQLKYLAPVPQSSMVVNNQSSSNESNRITNNKSNNNSKYKSMKEKRKQRAPKPFHFPKPTMTVMDVPRPDAWDKVQSTEEKIHLLKEQEETQAKVKRESEERAKELIRSQRKSVAVLTHVKECVLTRISGSLLMEAWQNNDCYIVDDFLYHPSQQQQQQQHDPIPMQEEQEDTPTSLLSDLAQEILEEGQHMYDNNDTSMMLMKLDIQRGIASGEYMVPITGGDQYVHCPRSVEFVVALTRHLNQCLEGSLKVYPYELDNTKTMASYRFYNRLSRSKALQLLSNQEKKDFYNNEKSDNDGVGIRVVMGGTDVNVNDTSDLPVFDFSTIVKSDDLISGNDLRKITAVYYVTPSTWNSIHGGGISFLHGDNMEEKVVDAMKDRLVLFDSAQLKHKWNPWVGDDDQNRMGGVIVAHLVGVPRSL